MMFRGTFKKIISEIILLISGAGDNIITSGGDRILIGSSQSGRASDVKGEIAAVELLTGKIIPEVIRGRLNE